MGDQTIERIPMDLAPTPVLKVEPPRNSPGAALLRTVPLPQQQRYLTTNIQSSTSSVSTPSPALVKQGVSGSTMGPAVINRLTTMPVSAGTTSTYHVPRGAAAVANIAVPRSTLATPIIRGSSTLQTIGVATSSSQQGFMRAVSPAGRGTTSWVGVTTHATVRPTNNNNITQNRMAVTTRIGPGTTVSTRPVLLQAAPPHKQLSITQTPNQVQITEKKMVSKGPGVGRGVRLGGATGGPRITPPLRPVVSLHPTAVLVSSPTPPPPTRPGTVSVLTSAVRVTSAPPGSGVQGSKVYCQPSEGSVYIQATHKPAQSANVVSIPKSLYSLPANSFYDTSTNFRTFTTAPVSTTPAIQQTRPTLTQVQGLVSTVPVRLFNPRMAVDSTVHPYVPSESAQTIQSSENCNNASNLQPQPQQTVHKQNASPRPSILRKRDPEGTPGKAAKNLNPLFSTLSVSTPSSPPRPESRGAGGPQSSGGSTTISATSSPGLGTDSPPLKPDNTEDDRPLEMSPRKKPRKQQLTGNQIQEPKYSEEEMEFIPSEKIKKTSKEGITLEAMVKPAAKRPVMSMLRTYRPTWKTKHNHFLRYSDVKPSKEKRLTVSDIASQKNVMQKCNGWKIYHLAAQMTEISDLEMDVFDQLTAVLKASEKKAGKDGDINRVNELIKGNIQRSKVITDQLAEAKCQVMKLFDHKCQVTEMLNRFSSRRSGKKRERV
ncbi:histone deacetylase complex subunit SAP130 [Macrosteles quadrilineatus]|uniref:histone deacetylase complex subunit SAP130 n=1 Tax=Macrosteles quadrilineatus TaxID=74068 RepID=UPI0023E326BE|nr:histone deacetylase complex subunit SAP130 [Macrosteles quadrilineatus]